MFNLTGVNIMPMDFQDLKSLKMAARIHKFRDYIEGEDESVYCSELFEHVLPRDRIEAFEIKFGKGWDQWSQAEKMESLRMKP